MKTNPRLLLAALLCAFFTCVLLAPAAVAQAAPAVEEAHLIAPETAAAIAQPFIVTASLKYPWVITVLVVIGGLRFFFKPLTSLVEAYVRSTPQTKDDEFFDRVRYSPGFKWVAWLLDFGASIKVGPQFTAEPKKETKA